MDLKLRELRKNNNLTQTEVGKYLNMTQSTYQTYENNRAIPPLDKLIKIADYYNVSLDYLCNHRTKHQQDIGYLNEEQITLLKLIKELNEINLVKAIGYVSGLIAGQ